MDNVFSEIAQRIRQHQLWRATFLEMRKPPAIQDQHVEPLQPSAPVSAGAASRSMSPSNDSFNQQRNCARVQAK
jgi:hypothetical protein